MKKIITTILTFIILTISLANISYADNLNIQWDIKTWVAKTSYVDNVWGWFGSAFFGWNQTWEKWISNLLVNWAKDLKDVLIAASVLYLFILVLRIIYWQWSEDDFKKFRIWILWTTFGIVLMQISYVAVTTMYDKQFWAATAQDLTDAILVPFIKLLELITSFLFLAMAFTAFYRIVTSWGWDDGFKKWWKTIMNAVIGFILVKISAALVYSVYWKNTCIKWTFGTQQCSDVSLWYPNLSDTAKIIASTIKYITGFLWITTVLLIIFAWFMILTSWWDEGKIKKWKATIKYIAIWLLLIITSTILFNLIIWREWSNIVWSYK